MSKFKLINLKEAKKMSEDRLQLEIGRRANYLRKELGMDPDDCAMFISSLLNLGSALNDVFENKKSFKNNK